MNDLNQVVIEGRLVKDPRARRFESGALVCTFTIASNISYVNKTSGQWIEHPTYLLIESWRNVAEVCVKYLHKGDRVRIGGKIKQSKWEKEPRVVMERTFISAEHVEFLPKYIKSEPEKVPEPVKAEEADPTEIEQEQINEEIQKEAEE